MRPALGPRARASSRRGTNRATCTVSVRPRRWRGSVDREEYPVAIELETGEVVYCVEWDDAPGKPVFCRGKKLSRAE